MKTEIIVTCSVEGFHRWPAAFEDVKFLATYHRHMFHVTAKKEVSHDNREIEIITFKRLVEKYMCEHCTWEHKSCEMIAKELMMHFGLSSCRVMEDKENGAEVTA